MYPRKCSADGQVERVAAGAHQRERLLQPGAARRGVAGQGGHPPGQHQRPGRGPARRRAPGRGRPPRGGRRRRPPCRPASRPARRRTAAPGPAPAWPRRRRAGPAARPAGRAAPRTGRRHPQLDERRRSPAAPARPAPRRGRPAQGGDDVAPLRPQPVRPADRRDAPARGRPLGQRQVVGGVPVARRLGLAARLGQALGGVLAHRLQQPVAPRAGGALVHLHQRLVDQPRQQVEHRVRGEAVARADRLGGLQRPAAGEDRQPPQQRPLRLGQQVVAPVERRPQRLLARQRGPAAAGQQPEAVVQPPGDLLDRQRPARARPPARSPAGCRPAAGRPRPPPRRCRR